MNDHKNHLKKCWEILNCGRQKDGDKVHELGECPASREDMGHTCWCVAGTLCEGKVQGTYAQKLGNCVMCEVHDIYHPEGIELTEALRERFPDEVARYKKMMLKDLEEHADKRKDGDRA